MTLTLRLGQVCVSSRSCRRIPHNPNARLHPLARHRWNKAWEQEVYHATLVAKPEVNAFLAYRANVPGLPKVHVSFYQIATTDADNLAASQKGLVDSLKHLGLIDDDSPKHITLLPPTQVMVGHRVEEHVEVEIEA